MRTLSRHFPLALLLSVLLGPAVATESRAAPPAVRVLERPPSEGMLLTDGGTVFVFHHGALRGIPDDATRTSLGLDGRYLSTMSPEGLRALDMGPGFPHLKSNLLTYQGSVFFLFWGMKWWIPDSDTLRALVEARLNTGEIVMVSSEEFESIPEGVPSLLPDYLLLSGSYTTLRNTAFGMDGGRRRGFLDDHTRAVRGYRDLIRIPDFLLQTIPEGEHFKVAYDEGDLLAIGGTVFVIQQGKRCGFPDECTLGAFYGFSIPALRILPESASSDLPEGPGIPAVDPSRCPKQPSATPSRLWGTPPAHGSPCTTSTNMAGKWQVCEFMNSRRAQCCELWADCIAGQPVCRIPGRRSDVR